MENFKDVIFTEQFERAVSEITAGGKFNKKVYTDSKGYASVYVNDKRIDLCRIKNNRARLQQFQKEFLSLVNN